MALILEPKHACKITMPRRLSDSTTIVFSSGIVSSSNLEIKLLSKENLPFFTLLLKEPTLFAVLKSTGMFSPSQ